MSECAAGMMQVPHCLPAKMVGPLEYWAMGLAICGGGMSWGPCWHVGGYCQLGGGTRDAC